MYNLLSTQPSSRDTHTRYFGMLNSGVTMGSAVVSPSNAHTSHLIASDLDES